MLLELSSKLDNLKVETTGTLLALQSCIGNLTRAMGHLRRHTESLCRKLEARLEYEVRTIRTETEDDAMRLSRVVSSTTDLAKMNKLQLELLAQDFNHHSCTASSSHRRDSAVMMDTTTTEEELLADHMKHIHIRRDARQRGEKSPILLKTLFYGKKK